MSAVGKGRAAFHIARSHVKSLTGKSQLQLGDECQYQVAQGPGTKPNIGSLMALSPAPFIVHWVLPPY